MQIVPRTQGLRRAVTGWILLCSVALSGRAESAPDSHSPRLPTQYTPTELIQAAERGHLGQLPLTRVVGHLGFTRSAYLASTDIDHMLQVEVGERPADTLHVVLLTDSGIAPALLAQAEKPLFVRSASDRRHGQYLVLTSENLIQSNQAEYQRLIHLADAVVICGKDEPESPENLMARFLSVTAEQAQSMELLLKEGGQTAFSILTKVGLLHRFSNSATPIAVTAGRNLLAADPKAEQGLLAATGLHNLRGRLGPSLDGMNLSFSTFAPEGNSAVSHKTDYDAGEVFRLEARYDKDTGLNVWIIPRDGTAHIAIRQNKFRLAFSWANRVHLGEVEVGAMQPVILNQPDGWNTRAYFTALDLSAIEGKVSSHDPLVLDVSITDSRPFSLTPTQSILESSSDHKLLLTQPLPEPEALAQSQKNLYLTWLLAQRWAVQNQLKAVQESRQQNLMKPFPTRDKPEYSSPEQAARQYQAFLRYIAEQINETDHREHSAKPGSCPGSFSQ